MQTISDFLQRYWANVQWELILTEILSKAISLALLIILFLIGRRVLKKLFQKTIESSWRINSQNPARQKTLIRLMENTMNYCLYFILAYWILSILGIPVSSLLAGAGIAGVAIGLGAQGFLKDVINGLFILLERQYDVGDAVIIGQVTGTVASVGLRTTQVRGYDGTLHFIPNGNITVVSNQSRGDMRALIEIPLFTDTDLSIVYDTIDQVNSREEGKHPEIVKGPTIIGPQTKSNGQFVFRVSIFTTNGQQYTVYNEFLKFYQESLLEAGIALPTANAHSTVSEG